MTALSPEHNLGEYRRKFGAYILHSHELTLLYRKNVVEFICDLDPSFTTGLSGTLGLDIELKL